MGGELGTVRRAVGVLCVLACAVALGGCFGDDEEDGTPTSPVSGAARSNEQHTGLAPLLVSAVEPAVPFKASSGRYLVSYELRLHNATPLTLAPTRVSVATPDGTVLRKLDAAQTRDALSLPSARSGARRLTEGQQATLYLTLDFERRSAIPDRLVHRIVAESGRLSNGRVVSSPASVKVLRDFDVPVLSPPLQAGRGYVAADSCCSSARHRRALLPIGDRLWLSQRFAVDWEQLDASDRFVKRGGDPAKPADYAIYGQRALAAADATVTYVLDGQKEQVPGALPVGITLPLADGNSIVAKLDGGLYMLYAHLQSGSLKVKKGDKIKRGDVIGLVGNSGNTSAPHLHFHVMDGPSPMTSEGVPYVIDAFATRGRLRSTAVFDRYENTTTPFDILPFEGDSRNEDELPLDLTVVDFG